MTLRSVKCGSCILNFMFISHCNYTLKNGVQKLDECCFHFGCCNYSPDPTLQGSTVLHYCNIQDLSESFAWSGIFHNFFEVNREIVLNWQIWSKLCAEICRECRAVAMPLQRLTVNDSTKPYFKTIAVFTCIQEKNLLLSHKPKNGEGVSPL